MTTLFIFRKSENTNNFGQTGYWGINKLTGEAFSFATYHDITKGANFSPEAARARGIEVSHLDLEGVVPKAKIKEFTKILNLVAQKA